MQDFDPMDHFNPDEDVEILGLLACRALDVFREHTSSHPVTAPHMMQSALEVGTWAGFTARFLSKIFPRVYCVDTWRGNPCDQLGLVAERIGEEAAFETFCSNMGSRLYTSVIPCRGASLQYAKIWPHPLALIFIDGDHRYEHVAQDIRAWLPHVAPGGTLCGHDYCPAFPGVIEAVNERFHNSELRVRHTMWWHVKN